MDETPPRIADRRRGGSSHDTTRSQAVSRLPLPSPPSPSRRIAGVEVSLFPNPRRPGIGLKPRREAQRPLLPQHARLCPVLEAGSTVGFMVHPPLAEKETFQIGYEGEGRYQFVYSVNPKGKNW